MSRIFISYRREDSAGEAGRIYDHLERKFGRKAIFKDVDVLKPGDNFRDRINEAVGQCEILLAIIGRRWLQVQDTAGRRRLDNPADWVRLEIETALQRDVRVIPILLDGLGMPAMQDLPESLQPLCYRNAARVRHDPDFRQDIGRVIRVIEHNLDKIDNPGKQSSAKQKNKKSGRLSTFFKVTKSLFSPHPSLQFFNSAAAKQKEGNFRGAIADYDEAIALNPDDPVAYCKRGDAKSALGDKVGAIFDYDKAIQIESDYTHTYHRRGDAKSALGDQLGAISDYKKAMSLAQKQGNNVEYYNLAQKIKRIS